MKWFLVAVGLVVAAGVAVTVAWLSEPEPVDFAVVTDVELGLTPEDQFVPHFSTGVWSGVLEGSTLTIEQYHMVGDEAGESTTIVLDVAGELPQVVAARWEASSAYGRDRDQVYTTGTLALQAADLGGIVAGVLSPTGSEPIPFWVDMRRGFVVDAPYPGERFEVPVGGLIILRHQTVARVVEVLEDSRCPEDATCVWEGAVRLAITVYEDGEPAPAVLHGLHTSSGPIFGDNPSVEVMRGERTLSLTGLESEVATFVTELVSR